MKRVVIESPYNPSKEQIEARAKLNNGVMISLDLAPCDSCPDTGVCYTCGYPATSEYDTARVQLIKENVQYARLLYKKALEEGHAPFASHLNYTQVLSEEPGFRERGIAAGFAWKEASDEVWYGADLRWSESLKKTHRDELKSFRTIRLFPDWTESQVRAHLAGLPFEALVGAV